MLSVAAMTVNQLERLFPLGGTVGFTHMAQHGQAMAVLHQDMAHVTELRRLTVAFLVKPCLGIGRALMGFVRALLFVETAFGVAARAIAVVVSSILPAEALDRGPSLDQRPV